MDLAPAVRYPTGRSGFHLFAVVGCAIVGALAAVAFVVQQGMDARAVLLWCGIAGTAWVSAANWQRVRPGVLQWDGQNWSLGRGSAGVEPSVDSGSAVANLRVALDMQTVLLVRASDQQGRVHWVWLQRSSCPDRWMDMRRALVCSERLGLG